MRIERKEKCGKEELVVSDSREILSGKSRVSGGGMLFYFGS